MDARPSRDTVHDLPPLTREETIHVINRILIPRLPTTRPIPRVPPAYIARRRPRLVCTLPHQRPVRELDVVVLVLADDDDGVGQLAGERVRVGGVDGGAEGVVSVNGGVADDIFGGVDEVDDGEEILGVVAETGLRFGEVEGAGAWCVSWCWCWGRCRCWCRCRCW